MADRDPEIKLGDFTERAEAFVGRGFFESIEDVVEAALDALDQQQRGEADRYATAVREAIANPGRFLPMDEAFAELDERKRIRRGA